MPQPRYFRTIVADPPWPEKGGGRIKRGADKHYDTLDKPRAVIVPQIYRAIVTADVWRPHPDGCHLWLWYTNNYLEACLWLMKALGARYLSQSTWAKEGRQSIGQYLKGKTEHCMLGRMGKQTLRPTANVTTLFGNKLVPRPCYPGTKKTIHSAKPPEAYEDIMKVSPAPRLEMFARDPRKGWTVWGNEV